MYGVVMEPSRPLTKTVGDNITAAIDTQGLIQQRVAEAAGIPRTTFKRHVAGNGDGFTVRQIEAIGHHLNVDPIMFFKVIL